MGKHKNKVIWPLMGLFNEVVHYFRSLEPRANFNTLYQRGKERVYVVACKRYLELELMPNGTIHSYAKFEVDRDLENHIVPGESVSGVSGSCAENGLYFLAFEKGDVLSFYIRGFPFCTIIKDIKYVSPSRYELHFDLDGIEWKKV